MKISLNWLKDFIETAKTADELSVLLTDVGLEVESLDKVESVKGGLSGLVVGLVKECIQHPNADRLRITKVDVGQPELLQIVCGAPNVAVGQKVIVALVGTTVHPLSGESFKISKSKIRGEVSEGMICAEDEIGLGKSHEGILVLPADLEIGTLASEYFKISSDFVFEIGLTPNRADAASHLGVARDLAAILQTNLKSFELALTDASVTSPISVEVLSNSDCKRYSAIYLQDVVIKESPQWLKNRLQSIGLKPINNVVDISNYVCHALGQPMHAFDADKIAGNKIIVRKAKAGEQIITLDNVDQKLVNTDTVICDESKPLCIAGVMGGINSSVDSNTKNIFLESAYFDATSVRKTSKTHNLKSDSSFRFERGTDPNLTLTALKYAVKLLAENAEAKSNFSVIDIYPEPILESVVDLSYFNTARLIGKKIPSEIIRNILTGLEIKILEENEEGLKLKIPTSKVDVTRECDVIEEILRIYGLNQIEMPSQLRSSLSFSNQPDEENTKEIISELLSSLGYHEMMSNSLTTSEYHRILNTEDEVKILNPLSNELDVLRGSLYFSGLEAVSYNQNRKQQDLKLYEFGSSYHFKNEKYSEVQHLTLFISGNKSAEHWNQKQEKVTVYTLTAIVGQILNRLGLSNYQSSSYSDAVLSKGFSYSIKNTELVKLGVVPKAVLKKLDINSEVWIADFNWDAIFSLIQKRKINYLSVPKFPAVRRDLSMLLEKKVQFEQLETIARKTEKNLLKEVSVFDVYEGDKLPAGKKSYALSFLLQDEEKTLTDQEIDQVMNKLINQFEKEAGAEIRKA